MLIGTCRAYFKQIREDITFTSEEIEKDLINRFSGLETKLDFTSSILRTNYFDRNDNDPIVLKMKRDNNIEFFVFHDDFEGIYIKEDMMSRGGIRLSNEEYYRDEALKLCNVQCIKNSCITPFGGKGCILPKSNDKKKCYLSYIRSILSITDNIVNGEIQRYKYSLDGDDFYFVVAADKGTGDWLDDANKLANDIWIGNAFASGSSSGFNHKAMAITSKGAWISAKFHFKNHNINENNISTVGVGSMVGDIFGNGMLMSRGIKLYGAIGSSEIFIDPNPNERSYDERKRLFDNQLPWNQYSGAYVYDRNTEEIVLDDEVVKFLSLSSKYIKPNDLINKILYLPVDMVFLGGVGTYIDDNNSHNIRAKIIVEGANLGVTDSARNSLSNRGIGINTDFFDNSAGVQCSALEVDLKTGGVQNVLEYKEEAEKIILQTNIEHNLILEYYIKKLKSNKNRPELCRMIFDEKKKFKKMDISIPINDITISTVRKRIPSTINAEEFIRKHPFGQKILKTCLINEVFSRTTNIERNILQTFENLNNGSIQSEIFNYYNIKDIRDFNV